MDDPSDGAPTIAQAARSKTHLEGELVKGTERSANAPEARFACIAPREFLRWLTEDGELLPVRCKASNRCPYCAWLAASENVAVVALDATDEQPTVGMTLTTRDPDFDMTRFRDAARDLFRWLRHQYGSELAYLMLMEWTTGSGGHGRLPHAHVLVKRLPAGVDLGPGCQLWQDVKARWERLTGAWRVELRKLLSPGGAVGYMVGHHHKREQAPPEGWSGKRFRPSKNYFVQPIAELREQVRHDRRMSIALYQLALRHGPELDLLDVRELLAAELSKKVELVWLPRGECTGPPKPLPVDLR
jgi:hypothetical protein